MSGKPWDDAEIRSLRRLYPDRPAKECAERLGRSLPSVYAQANLLGLSKSAVFKASDLSGRIHRGRKDPRMVASQFRKGMTPWNKGTHYDAGGRSAETRFKPGSLSGRALQRLQPIGAERLDKGGLLIRKVNNGHDRRKRWRAVHALVWEETHGPIPIGSIVIFRVGKKTNVASEITADKLVLITRAENMRRNSYMTRYPKEVADLMRLRGALNRKINNREARR